MISPQNTSSKSFECNLHPKRFHEFRKDERGRPIDACSVDIIIPFHGQYESVRQLVRSILQYTRSNPYRITLVDDCSPNRSFIETMRSAPQTQCLRLEKHSGFGAAINAGISTTFQPYICLLHSDCLIKNANWLEALGCSLLELKPQGVRIVTARTSNPEDNSLELEKAHVNSVEDVIATDPIPLYCALFHRELIKRLGGGLKEYDLTWYENVELAYRMNRKGFRQAVSGKSFVFHKGGGTLKPLWESSEEVKQIIRENYERCMQDVQQIVNS